ncbi:MAG: type II toxin-antitoxin system RelE/ParE family toxin [Salinivirgaceae bacterium]|jgi:toxin ParE1/3/4|nr:type II toxin-antitoxin system RelE/ParE family toxin [Salinivirgaceae bacterium]
MGNFVLANKAVENLSGIWNYTFYRWSEKQADFYYQILLENCKEIAEYPKLGKYNEGLAKLLYGHRVGQHLIFYRTTKKK